MGPRVSCGNLYANRAPLESAGNLGARELGPRMYGGNYSP